MKDQPGKDLVRCPHRYQTYKLSHARRREANRELAALWANFAWQCKLAELGVGEQAFETRGSMAEFGR